MTKYNTPITSAVQLNNTFILEVYLFLLIPGHYSTGYPAILQSMKSLFNVKGTVNNKELRNKWLGKYD
jgi:hypothetical protein